MIRILETLSSHDAPLAGGKAASLGALSAAGLPVPPGFCVTTAAYEAAVAADPALAARLAAPEPDAIARAFSRTALPAAIESGVREAYRALSARLGAESPSVAVRSSAIGEDGEGASFAGQHQTFLNAAGEDEVLLALKACWAGLWSERAIAYRRRLAGAPAPAIAVLVQALVVPEAAGVAFTAHPVTGDRSEIAIDASWGLGEAVVSGRATPDHVRVDKATGAVRAYAIGEKEVEVVPQPGGVAACEVSASRRQARCLGAGAIAALHALALSVEALAGAPQDLEWAWADGRIHLLQARPITALPPPPPPGGWESPVPGARWERRNFAEHFPGPVSPLAETLVLPAVGARLHALAREVGHELPAPALTAIHGYVYARGDMARRWDMPLRACAHGLGIALGDPRRWEHGEGHAARLDRLLAQSPEGAPALAAWIEAYTGHLAATWADLHRLSAGWRWTEYALRRALGGDMIRTGVMLSGFAAPAGRHASPASFDPAVPMPPAAPVADEARLAAMAARREAAIAEALAAASGLQRPLLRRLIPWAQAYARVREPALLALGRGWDAFRARILALGAALGLGDDVFLLRWDEIRAMAAGGPAPAPAELAARRAIWRDREAHSPPLVIGEPPTAGHARVIGGVGASGGTATGPCRVITSPDDFELMRPGEILVAPATTPAWTPLFHHAAAIVTDVGGPLSHGSIVAREFGIPAVLGAESASRRLRTGMIVTVDGDQGFVWIGGV